MDENENRNGNEINGNEITNGYANDPLFILKTKLSKEDLK